MAIFLAFTGFLLLPVSFDSNANAFCMMGMCVGSGGGISDSLCTIVNWFVEGNTGKAIASFAIIFLGLQAFFGKLQWGTAVMFTAGIAVIFGANSVVEAITGVSSACTGGSILQITL